MRIMALDLGAKRVGVALSDELGLIAGPLTVLNRRPHTKFLEDLAKLVEEHGVARIVLGLPMHLDGRLGPEAQRALSMAHQLKTHLAVDVETWDERLSTVTAERVLIEADMSRKKRKQVVDKVAAAVILQGYLDARGSVSRETD